MPASIVTSLLLWSALLLPGASADPSRSVEGFHPLWRQGLSVPSFDAMAAVRAWPLGQDRPWTISEADTEEEESDDGDRIASSIRWIPPRFLGSGHVSTIRRGRGVLLSATRSPILRC